MYSPLKRVEQPHKNAPVLLPYEPLYSHMKQQSSYEFLPQKYSAPYLKSSRDYYNKLKIYVLKNIPTSLNKQINLEFVKFSKKGGFILKSEFLKLCENLNLMK